MTTAKKEFTREEADSAVAYLKEWQYDIPQHVYEVMLPTAEAFSARLAEDEQRSKRTGILPIHIEQQRREAASPKYAALMEQGRKMLSEDELSTASRPPMNGSQTPLQGESKASGCHLGTTVEKAQDKESKPVVYARPQDIAVFAQGDYTKLLVSRQQNETYSVALNWSEE